MRGRWIGRARRVGACVGNARVWSTVHRDVGGPRGIPTSCGTCAPSAAFGTACVGICTAVAGPRRAAGPARATGPARAATCGSACRASTRRSAHAAYTARRGAVEGRVRSAARTGTIWIAVTAVGCAGPTSAAVVGPTRTAAVGHDIADRIDAPFVRAAGSKRAARTRAAACPAAVMGRVAGLDSREQTTSTRQSA